MLVCCASTLGGCGMSSLTSGIGGGLLSGSSSAKPQATTVSNENLLTAAKADQPEVAAADIAGGCPHFAVWTRDGQVTVYDAGRTGDGLAVLHQGEITKTARECRLDNNRLSIKYGFSGKVLLGPKGKTGTVRLPLTVFVTDAKRERVAQDSVHVEVAVALEKPIGYFSAVHEFSFVLPEGSRPGDYEVFVGFDRNIPGAG